MPWSLVSVVLVPAWLALHGPEPELEPEVAPEPEASASEAEQPDAEAQRLFDEGVDKFDTADYAGAIELWTRAYGLVPSTPENAAVKAKLIANIAAAQERAYAVDAEVSHLNQAKILLHSYRDAIADIYPGTIEREKELAWVEQRLGKIEAELAAVAEREAAAREAAARQADGDRPTPGRGLLIGGGVVTGLGVGALGVMVTGMVLGGRNNAIDDLPTTDLDTRAERFDQGRLGNTLAIAGAAGGAVLVGAGVALLVIGAKQRRAAPDRQARWVPQVVPQIDRHSAGLGVVGRF